MKIYKFLISVLLSFFILNLINAAAPEPKTVNTFTSVAQLPTIPQLTTAIDQVTPNNYPPIVLADLIAQYAVITNEEIRLLRDELYNAINSQNNIKVNEIIIKAKSFNILNLVLNNTYFNPLMLAISSRNYEIVPILLAEGANVNAKHDSVSKNTALITACACNHKEIVKILLAAGAEINAKNSDGLTALHYAIQRGNQEIANMLRAAGATD